MFKYSTCTLLNKLTDDNGVSKLVATGSGATAALTIHRLGKFAKANVTKIYKRVGTAGTAGSSTLTCVASTVPSKGTTETVAGIYRLKLYVKLSGNNDAFYANDFVFKGKPYAYEFEIKKVSDSSFSYKNKLNQTATETTAAKAIAAAAKAAIERLASRFNDIVFNVTVADDVLTITTKGADNVYRRISECVLQKFDATVNSPLIGGEYVDVAEGVETKCVNPFGTYGEIIKDLRLPTPEHTGWTSLMSDEMPVAGTIYNQYIIYMCVNRGIMGGDAVGQPAKSVTAHSIWVPQALDTSTVAAEIAKLGTVESYDATKLSDTQEDTPASAFAKADEADLVK